jgi:uncharacterized protein YqhQ
MPDLNVGGQAVIEGVMMRSADRIATAVRIPSGEILVKTEPYLPLSKRYKLLALPVLRGAISFVEMMIIGIRTLHFSGEIAVAEAEKEEAIKNGGSADDIKPKKSSNFMLGFSVLFAMVAGIGIFFYLPLFLANLFDIDRHAVGFNLAAGAIRLLFFVGYVWAISFFGEFQRVFQYHGAEHKSIYAHEMGEQLTPQIAATHTRFHPRCGTSFILIVALIAMMTYAISDSIYTVWAGHPPELLTRFLIHFALLPVVAGGSYELLKLSGKTRDNAITRILIQPGLWLQRITTKEPSLEQLEVAIVALETALGRTESNVPSPRTVIS